MSNYEIELQVQGSPSGELTQQVDGEPGGGSVSAREAEAWARGTRAGTAVSSDDPTYHNNSKYYAEQAHDAAESASAAYGTNLLAPTFDASQAYPAGAHVIHDGGYYVLPEGHTAGDTWAETSKTQQTVGGEVTGLKSALSGATGNTFYPFIEGKYITTSGTSVNISSPSSADGYRYTVAECAEGDVFYVTGRGSIAAGLWTFAQTDGTIISKSDVTTLQTDLKIVAPANSKYLVVNSNRAAKCYKNKLLVDRVVLIEAAEEANTTYIDGIKVFEQTGNIFNGKENYITGQYYYRSGSALVIGTNSEYNGFIIPVAKNKQYTFTTSNIVLLDETKSPLVGSASWDYEGVKSCNSGNASFFAVSYRISYQPEEGYCISEGGVLDYGAYSGAFYAKPEPSYISNIARKSGAIADGGLLTINGKTAIKDGQEIVFKGFFSSFGTVTINFSGSGSTNKVEVDSTNLTIINNTNHTITEAHGLTIANEITILCEIKNGNMYISVTSGGITYKTNCFWNQTGGVVSETSVSASDMSFTDAQISNVYSCAKRGIWYFGDSYVQFGTDTRIPYYINEYGYIDDILISGVSGGTTTSGITAFQTLLSYGLPKFAVFALGMNNGSDSSSEPPSGWVAHVEQFLALCDSYGITPVLCTIPTVPSVNNEQKNAWIASWASTNHGRVVDYAKAVGANASGEWYAGMLSSDNVHPSTTGGNALFTQLLIDLPEIMGE